MRFTTFLTSIILIAFGYILGSIPSGVWYSILEHKIDIRGLGSGNSGTTNVGRNFGFKAAAIVAVCDVLKGLLPVLITSLLFPNKQWLIMLVGGAALLGHAYPMFANFKGGKIVATSIGLLLATHFSLALAQIITLFAILYITSIMSFSALLSFGAACLYILIASPYLSYKIGFLCIFIFMCYRHRENIQRLIHGQEREIGWGLHKN